MTQPTPIVSQADVERIVKRDYSQERFDQIMSMLNEYGANDWQRESHRVRLAVLKLANGNIEELRRIIEWAKNDYRDVIAPAEYPMATKKLFTRKTLTEEEMETIYKKDWDQYQQWINQG